MSLAGTFNFLRIFFPCSCDTDLENLIAGKTLLVTQMASC